MPFDPTRRKLSNLANRTSRRIFLLENLVGRLDRQRVKGIVEQQEDIAQGRKTKTNKSSSYRKRIVTFLVLFAIALGGTGSTFAVRAFAGLSLVYEYKQMPINGLDYCYHEDWIDYRTWEGSLAPGESFTVTLRYCDLLLDGRTQGGGGFIAQVAARGVLGISIVAPNESLTREHLTGRVQGRDIAAVCVLRSGTDFQTGQHVIATHELLSGYWTVTLHNDTSKTVRDITYVINVHGQWTTLGKMQSCPPDDVTVT